MGRSTRSGPLTRVRSRPGDPQTQDVQPCYRLADHLAQISRAERAGVYPPDSLWTAFTTTITDPELLLQLGEALLSDLWSNGFKSTTGS